MIASIAVYCGSSAGNDPRFGEAARELGALLAAEGIALVYGGARVGLMGMAADAALAGGGRVVGVMPGTLAAREIAHAGLTEFHAVDSMHTRKALMADRADAFAALPGGFGTLDELFEVLTWLQIGLHRKPCALLNVAGFYDGLLRFLDGACAAGMLAPAHRGMLLSAGTPRELLRALREAPEPPPAKFAERMPR